MPANLSKPSYYKTKLDHSIEIVNQESGNCQSLNMSSRLYKCEINRLDEKITLLKILIRKNKYFNIKTLDIDPAS